MFEIPGTHYHVQSRTLVVASIKQIRLDSYFDGGENLIYRPDDLGRILTAAEAVDAHERRALRCVDSARIALRNAEDVAADAVEWSTRWRREHA